MARPSGRLDGLVCLITGSTGIGAASAGLFAAEGARVFVSSRSGDHCAALAERVASHGGSIAWRAADLAVETEVAAVVEACIGTYGRIDALFAVAGGSGRRFGDGPIHGVSQDAWEATLRLNLTTQALITGAVVRRMLEQDPAVDGTRGSILLMGSVTATDPAPEHFATHAYAAARGGTIALMTTMAATYARDGIRVNAVAPGLTRTPMADRAANDPAVLAYAARRQPLAGPMLDAEDVARAALFLLSPDALAVTGQLLKVDGGWSVVDPGMGG